MPAMLYRRFRAVLATSLALAAAPLAALGEDVRFEVSFDRAVRGEPATGRLVVFLIKEGESVWQANPADGPFWEDPQPLYGIDVQGLGPGEAVTIGADTRAPDA